MNFWISAFFTLICADVGVTKLVSVANNNSAIVQSCGLKSGLMDCVSCLVIFLS